MMLDNPSVGATSAVWELDRLLARCLWRGIVKEVVSDSPRSVKRKLVMLNL